MRKNDSLRFSYYLLSLSMLLRNNDFLALEEKLFSLYLRLKAFLHFILAIYLFEWQREA